MFLPLHHHWVSSFASWVKMMEQAVLEQYHYRVSEIQEKNNEGTKMYWLEKLCQRQDFESFAMQIALWSVGFMRRILQRIRQLWERQNWGMWRIHGVSDSYLTQLSVSLLHCPEKPPCLIIYTISTHTNNPVTQATSTVKAAKSYVLLWPVTIVATFSHVILIKHT